MNTRALFLLVFLIFPLIINAQHAQIIKAPEKLPQQDERIKIFLGGSIDMGTAEDWQQAVETDLAAYDVILLNPRRGDWNKDWKPVADEPEFRKQVEWELEALEVADYIIMYFAPASLSPISLLELGLYARSDKLMVVCPEGFWRKGNVDILSEKYQLENYKDLNSLLIALKQKITAGDKE